MSLLATGSVSLADLNDAIISGTAPSSPAIGTLWIDTSVNPSVLKNWNGSAWVPQTLDISNLDPVTVSNIITTLGNMADDNILDINERTTLKDQLTEIIGFVISNASATLPTASALDTSAKGDFYSVRRAAQLAGISTSDSTYVATATQWTTLSAYLNGMTPIKPWDVSSGNSSQTITVVRDTFRTNWLNYYQSIQSLAQATANSLNQAAQNAQNTANGKAKNWVTQPVPPYSVGDTYATSSGILYCITARASGSYTASDWALKGDITSQGTSNDTTNVNGRSSIDITQTIDGNSQAILDMNGQINAKVDQETYQTEIDGLNESMGVDQWHYQKYPLPSGYTSSTIPSYASIQGVNPTADSLVNDGTNIVQNSETNYVGHVQTAVYVATAKTITLTFSHDDACQVYVNGQSKYTKNAVTTGASLSLPLVQGWNTLEFFWTQVSGTAGVYSFSPTVRSLVDKMSCYYASLTGRVVANSEAQLLIQSGQISQKVSTTDYNGNTIGTLINQGTTTVKIQAARLELLTSSAFDPSTYNQINNDTIQIGGTNLVPNSTGALGSWVNATQIINSDGTYALRVSKSTSGEITSASPRFIIRPSTKYTFTVYARKSSNCINLDVHFLGSNETDGHTSPGYQYVHTSFPSIAPGATTYTKYTATFTTNSDEISGYVRIDNNGSTDGTNSTADFMWIKIEEGDKSTAWSSADIDQQSYADSAASSAQSGAVSQANTYTDGQVTTVNDSITNLQQQTQNAGGVNLVQNSLGIATVVDDTDPNFGKLLNWVYQSGTISPIVNGDIQALNFEGGIYFQSTSTVYATIHQDIYCPSDQISIGFYLSCATIDGGTESTRIGAEVYAINGDGSNGSMLGSCELSSTGATNNLPFKYLSSTVSVSGNSQVRVVVFAAPNTKGTITGLMVNDGAIPLRWSNYPSENYTTQMRLDQTGIKVIGETIDNYTEMTPDHFAGYAPDAETGIKTKIFELNGDVTHVHKLQADKYVELGSIRAVMFDNGTNTGWAFFPTNNQN